MDINTLNYNSWADNYTDYLFSFAYYKVGKKEEAEDLVQETFLSAYKGRENYNGTASEKTWLTAILKNKIIDYYRKPKIVDSFSTYLDQTEESFENFFFDQNNHGRWNEKVVDNYFSNAADGYIMGKEFQKFLSLCLEKMPAKLKSVFVSKYIEDEKTENICKEHNITSSNYWVIVFRSKTILRTCLEKKGVM
ncbi:MAG: sigma-70 family RNA polymerase sigma factor [Sphingobacteriales bacterium]|nr:MAG: sigma-70 family RNA polymerase sigma factor [Sphingobacteriales bacterium]